VPSRSTHFGARSGSEQGTERATLPEAESRFETGEFLDDREEAQVEALACHGAARAALADGDTSEALRLLLRALRLFEHGGAVVGQAAVLVAIADLHTASGEYERALQSWDRLFPLLDVTGDVNERALTLDKMAVASAKLDRWPQALELWRQALHIDSQLGTARDQAPTIRNIEIAEARLRARGVQTRSRAGLLSDEGPLRAPAALTDSAWAIRSRTPTSLVPRAQALARANPRHDEARSTRREHRGRRRRDDIGRHGGARTRSGDDRDSRGAATGGHGTAPKARPRTRAKPAHGPARAAGAAPTVTSTVTATTLPSRTTRPTTDTLASAIRLHLGSPMNEKSPEGSFGASWLRGGAMRAGTRCEPPSVLQPWHCCR
jgi:hypothetical protein